jgi:hypothetical protein
MTRGAIWAYLHSVSLSFYSLHSAWGRDHNLTPHKMTTKTTKKDSVTSDDKAIAELAIAQAVKETESFTVSIHRRDIDAVELARRANDARSIIGRMRTGATAGTKVGGSVSKGTLTDWEGHSLRNPETEKERKALAFDKAMTALIRVYFA